MEKTLVLLKPDAVQKGYIGNILSRFETKGLKISALKMMQMNDAIISEHYGHLADKPFFPEIVSYMTLGPIVALVLEGEGAVASVRNMCGPTNPAEAPLGTIRGDLALTIRYNVIHASDSLETAKEEVKRFFDEKEIFDYKKITDSLV